MRNPELKKKKKAKDSITSLANQCDNMREVIKSLADGARSRIDSSVEGVFMYGCRSNLTVYKCSCDGIRSKITDEDESSLLRFVTLSDRLCEDLEMYANILDGYSKDI